jgi:dephospho-CoA kinase
MKYKHYSPDAQIQIVRGNLSEFVDFVNKSDCDGVLCFEGEEEFFPDKKVVTFGSENDSLSQAQRLFDALRELDEKGAKNVLSRSPSTEGVGLAVCNRLYRAAAFRFIDGVRRPVVGLTGPTGAGKGYVSEYLESLGCYVCDTDGIARELTAENSPFLSVLTEHFGEDIVNDGVLDRKLLASRAFATKEKQELLNSLMHPEIIAIANERCREALYNGAVASIIDAPLLFEAKGDEVCDTVISVVAPKEIRLERIMKRDSITEEQALSRMSVQYEDSFYTKKSEFTVVNDGKTDVREALSGFVAKYLR